MAVPYSVNQEVRLYAEEEEKGWEQGRVGDWRISESILMENVRDVTVETRQDGQQALKILLIKVEDITYSGPNHWVENFLTLL